jgi:hypothetical protein
VEATVAQEWWRQVPPLRLDAEGRWFDQDTQVTNPRLAEFLLTHLTKDEDGRYVVVVGGDRRYVEVEDAPYRILGVQVADDAPTTHRLLLRVNDGGVEPFDPTSFWIGQDGIPYCLIRNRLHKARFTPEAYRQLAASMIVEDPESGRYVLQIGTERFSVPTRAPESTFDHSPHPLTAAGKVPEDSHRGL